jgi:hypothetical protein
VKTIDKSTLEEAAEEAGLDPEATLRFDYSGRGMYGKTCIGLVWESQGDVRRFLRALEEYVENGVIEEMEDVEGEDAMGLRGITYWPGFEAVDRHVNEEGNLV